MRTFPLASLWSVDGLRPLLHPASVFNHPRDVANNPELSIDEKARYAGPGRLLLARRNRSFACVFPLVGKDPSTSTKSLMRFAAWRADRSPSGSACFGANILAAIRPRMASWAA